jgi:hypothetical protein
MTKNIKTAWVAEQSGILEEWKPVKKLIEPAKIQGSMHYNLSSFKCAEITPKKEDPDYIAKSQQAHNIVKSCCDKINYANGMRDKINSDENEKADFPFFRIPKNLMNCASCKFDECDFNEDESQCNYTRYQEEKHDREYGDHL